MTKSGKLKGQTPVHLSSPQDTQIPTLNNRARSEFSDEQVPSSYDTWPFKNSYSHKSSSAEQSKLSVCRCRCRKLLKVSLPPTYSYFENNSHSRVCWCLNAGIECHCCCCWTFFSLQSLTLLRDLFGRRRSAWSIVVSDRLGVKGLIGFQDFH